MHAAQLLLGETFPAQCVEAVLIRLAASDRADVADRLAKHPAQRRQVELRVVSEDYHIRGAVELHLGQGFVRPGDDQLIGVWKTLLRGELRPGIDDRDPIAHQLGQAVQRDRDVDGPDDDEVRCPAKRLDEPITISFRQA